MLKSLPHTWFAVQVRPRCERMVSTLLATKGYEQLLPTYSALTLRGTTGPAAPLFPGYVFCRMSALAHGHIVTTPGVVRIVGTGRTPTPLDEDEMNSLRKLVESAIPRTPWLSIEKGELVEIAHGPLRGCRGTLLSHEDQQRLIMAVTLLNRCVAVAVERDWLRPMRQAAGPTPVSRVAVARSS
jgi:transcription termination/antitermination protein NusG